jgi:hypothetical protein
MSERPAAWAIEVAEAQEAHKKAVEFHLISVEALRESFLRIGRAEDGMRAAREAEIAAAKNYLGHKP